MGEGGKRLWKEERGKGSGMMAYLTHTWHITKTASANGSPRIWQKMCRLHFVFGKCPGSPLQLHSHFLKKKGKPYVVAKGQA